MARGLSAALPAPQMQQYLLENSPQALQNRGMRPASCCSCPSCEFNQVTDKNGVLVWACGRCGLHHNPVVPVVASPVMCPHGSGLPAGDCDFCKSGEAHRLMTLEELHQIMRADDAAGVLDPFAEKGAAR